MVTGYIYPATMGRTEFIGSIAEPLMLLVAYDGRLLKSPYLL